MSEHIAESDTRKRNPKVEMIWGLLAPFIASEDPPDLSNDDQAEILTAGALPQVWNLVLELEENQDRLTDLVAAVNARHEHGGDMRTNLANELWRALPDDLRRTIEMKEAGIG